MKNEHRTRFQSSNRFLSFAEVQQKALKNREPPISYPNYINKKMAYVSETTTKQVKAGMILRNVYFGAKQT